MAAKAYATTEICEIRYDGGYRYLDRCGDALIILEQLFGQLTGAVWTPFDPKPTAARLKCPSLDAILVIDAERLVFQAEGINRDSINAKLFDELTESALAIVRGKFQIGPIARIGFRTMFNVPFDNLADARQLLMTHVTPERPTNVPEVAGLVLKDFERVAHYVSEDLSRGYTLRTSVAERYDAPIEMDPRITMQSRLVGDALKKDLLEQIQRRNRPTLYPAAVTIDTDHFLVRPDSFDNLHRYLTECREVNSALLRSLLPERHQP